MTEKNDKESPWLILPLMAGLALIPFALAAIAILLGWWIS